MRTTVLDIMAIDIAIEAPRSAEVFFDAERYTLDKDGKPPDAFWFDKLDAFAARYRFRQKNHVVRMKIAADLRQLEDEADYYALREEFVAAFERWKDARR